MDLTRPALVRKALLLSWLTIGYNALEGAVSIGFGVDDESVALAGFGVDSLIEVASAVLVLWRFRGEAGLAPVRSLERERRATLGIGALFLVLAATTAGASFLQIMRGSRPETTIPGVAVSALSLGFMLYLWLAKMRLGLALGSPTVLSDARCSLACIRLSLILLAGSLLFQVAPLLWWIDAAAAAGIALLVGAEGVGTIRHARSRSFAGGCCPGGCSQA